MTRTGALVLIAQGIPAHLLIRYEGALYDSKNSTHAGGFTPDAAT